MPLDIECANCGKRYRVGEDKAGKKMRCRECQETIPVPALKKSKDDPFNVFDSSSDPLGKSDPFAQADPFAGSFEMGTGFTAVPTSTSGGQSAKKKSSKSAPPSDGPDMMFLMGIGAFVVIGLGVAAFLFFSRDRDGGNAVADNDGNGGAATNPGGTAVTGSGIVGGATGSGAEGETTGGTVDGELTGGATPVGETTGGGTVGGGTIGGGTVAAGSVSPIRTQVGFGNLGPNPTIRNESGTYSGTDVTYTFDGQAGQRASVALISTEFNPMLSVLTPGGMTLSNDNLNNTSSSMVQFALPETGRYTATVSSVERVGRFDLEIALSGAPMARVESGELVSYDLAGFGGAFEDSYTLQGQRNSRVRIQLSSPVFDTLLRLRGPDGSVYENDDMYGGIDSWLSVVLPADGQYEIVVTSYEPNLQGPYSLVIDQAPAAERVESGSLSFGDETLRTGELVDTYTFSGTAGRKVNITASSSEFDTYVILVPPSGFASQFDNDDLLGLSAELSLTLPESGQYEVLVTTFETGESGGYLLSIDFE